MADAAARVSAGVVTAPDRPDHHRLEPRCASLGLPHLAGIRQELQAIPNQRERAQRFDGTLRCDRARATLPGGGEELRIVASLEREPPSHARDRVDDEPE